ncbi:unnamed protein product [Clonostachys solani]|uniref:Nucleolar protein 56 n=1 Tax=Clonostachys solani TaxID=160281 RepID=A0A9N9Z8I6_9HYPO|nr:unnamed protein product [Clonostachys solani]
MSEIDYALFEAPVGYAVFKVVHQADVVSLKTKEGQETANDLSKFGKMVKIVNFSPFRGQKEALSNINEISEGQLPEYLKEVLEINLPKSGKKSKITLGVAEKNLAGAIKNAFPGLNALTADTSDVCAELLRGIRVHASKLIEGLNDGDLEQAGRGLGHAYSRGRIMFDPKRNDQSIMQALATVEIDDKGTNNSYMRLRETYGWHFPELSKIESDNYTYTKLVQAIGRKEDLTDEKLHDIAAIVGEDGEKAQAIIEAAKISMGRELGEEDHKMIKGMIEPLIFTADARKRTARDLEATLSTVAPNLQVLVGTMVAARLINAAGSLSTLAKYPASTLQILGAEKALFRALKSKSNTPKYGLIYHSTFIGRASVRDKGRISRYLANKCSIASRIDYFAEEPSTKWGEALKQQVEDRLQFYATGKRPAKNSDVMASVDSFGGLANEGADMDDASDAEDSDEEMADAPVKEKKSKKTKEEKASKKEKKSKDEKKEKKRKRESDATELVKADEDAVAGRQPLPSPQPAPAYPTQSQSNDAVSSTGKNRMRHSASSETVAHSPSPPAAVNAPDVSEAMVSKLKKKLSNKPQLRAQLKNLGKLLSAKHSRVSKPERKGKKAKAAKLGLLRTMLQK